MHYRLLSLIMVAIIAFGIGGCGGTSDGTSADPLETDSLMFGYKEDSAGTEWSTALLVNGRDTIILTAKVKNSSDEPVIDRRVSFDFATNASGATLSAYSAHTNSTGEASIIYTAGMAAGTDVVRAKISNGSTLITTITVVGTTNYGISVTASNDIAVMGGQSVVEAEVVYGSTTVSGVTVNFGVVFGGSAFGSVSPGSAVTDANGKAITIYKGGDVTAGGSYSDVVQASFTIGGITYTAAVPIIYTP